jgi:hypothetical protein
VKDGKRLVCGHPGCKQPFLHLYSLRAHEKTHKDFGTDGMIPISV